MRRFSYSIALGGVVSALCIVMELAVGIAPLFLYIFPMLCAILMCVLLEECGLKTALCAYAAVSVISLILCPDKEAAILYVGFFGYYPAARMCIQKINLRLARAVIKLALFNFAIVCSYWIMIKIFGAEALELDGGTVVLAALLGAGNLIFVLFEIVLGRILRLYDVRFKGRIFRNRPRGGRR